MRRLLFIGFTLVLFAVTGQKNAIYLDLNVGARFGGAVSYSTIMLPGLHTDAGVGFMFNDVLGIKGDVGYDSFSASQEISGTKLKDNSYMFRASLQAIVNLAEDNNFKNQRYGMFFHLGLGYSTINNSAYKDAYLASGGTFKDPWVKGNDDMANVIFGFTPKLNLNENLALNLDFTGLLFIKQSAYIDRAFSNEKYNSLSAIWNLSLGLSYCIN